MQNKYTFLRQICAFCVGEKLQATPDKKFCFTFASPHYAQLQILFLWRLSVC